MTSKSKNSVRNYETEIEKCREESKWKKAVELALQLKSRSPQHESLTHFLIGEGKLEAYLDEWPPIKDNSERAQRELSEARGYLTLATDEAGKKAGVALDAHLLLGKVNYACGLYEDALKNYKQAELSTLTEKELPIRSLRIVAESYAIKGLCLEETGADGASSRYKQAEREADMTRSFSLASDLTLLYLQRCPSGARAGPTLEAALPRAAALHLRAGRPQQAAGRYREMLMAVECQWTQSLRITVARQLVELLLRAAGGQTYKPPVALTMPTSQQGTLTRRREEQALEGPWKPKKYVAFNQFVPQSPYEEVFLVVLVGEALAARDAVLSQSAEFEAVRAHSLAHARLLADLLAPLATRWRQHALLLESLERAMKFSFGCAHVWRQRALATAAAAAAAAPAADADDGDNGTEESTAGVKARAVMSHARLLCPDDAPLRLVGASTCYNTGEIEEGIELAEEALSIEERLNGDMLARCHLYAGMGYQMKAQKTNSRIDKEAANATCLKHLLRAVQLDNNDHLAFYHLALQYMRQSMLNEAMDATRSCLRANSCCSRGLLAACALWAVGGAGARRGRALGAARLAALHYPAAAWPRAQAARLQLRELQPEAALATGKELLSLLSAGVEEVEFNAYETLSDSHDLSRRDRASLVAESLGGGGGGGGGGLGRTTVGALSDGASSLGAPPRAARRAAAWLLLAELCLALNRISAAAGCVAEAAALTPYSYLVIYTRGLVHEASAQWEEARECFRNACALNPTHIDGLVHLGSAYYETGWVRLAESVLRSAATLAPDRADTWRRLALVLAARGEHLAAADAAAAAVALQPTQSAVPLPL